LDLGVRNSFMTSQMVEWLGIKTKLLVDPITVHLAQGVLDPNLE
jgi:hypothetical protein